jgi:Family of unknown function (DUF5681)
VRQRNPGYTVGYGRPPAHSRFQKGRSGNPAGRRRLTHGERDRNLLWQEANRILMLREGDKIEKLTALQAAIRRMFLSAAQGNTAALKMVLQARNEIAADESWKAPQKIMRIIVDPNQPTDLSKLTEAEVEELARLLSIARETEPRLE